MAVATDVGAWRVLQPVVDMLRARGNSIELAFAEPAATHAIGSGYPLVRLDPDAVSAALDVVLDCSPDLVIVGTSTRPVIERSLTRRLPASVPTLGVLDATLFAAHRFAPAFRDLPTLLACPDEETLESLIAAGAPRGRLTTTGNPTLERFAEALPGSRADNHDGQPRDVLFVSQPVALTGKEEVWFLIDERQTLDELLGAVESLRDLAPFGWRIRVRLHPIEAAWATDPGRPNVSVELDEWDDRFASVRQADVVIGLSSSLLTEARIVGKPAIAHLPGDHWEAEVAFPSWQGVVQTRTTAQLVAAIRWALTIATTTPSMSLQVGASRRIADNAERLAASFRARHPAS